MSGVARLACVLALILGAVLFISALQQEGGDYPAPVENGNGNGDSKASVAAALPAKAGVLDSPENCKECHDEIYKEWEDRRTRLSRRTTRTQRALRACGTLRARRASCASGTGLTHRTL